MVPNIQCLQSGYHAFGHRVAIHWMPSFNSAQGGRETVASEEAYDLLRADFEPARVDVAAGLEDKLRIRWAKRACSRQTSIGERH